VTASPAAASPAAASTTAAISATGLTKRYGQTLALDDLDLTVEAGEVYGYLGPNGAGKTTTIRLLLGIHRPTAGRAELLGTDAWRDPVRAHRRVAYVAGEPYLWPAMTGAETLEFLARVHGGVDTAYRDQLVQRFGLDTKKKVRTLSKGNRQKVQLIAALATRADLLIMDEPTSGLDPLMEMAFRECVTEEGPRADGLPVLAHPQRGRGRLRPGRDPPRGEAGRPGHAGRAAAPEHAHDRGHVRRRGARAPAAARRAGGGGRPQRAPLRDRGPRRAGDHRPGRAPGHVPGEP
jgi:ABC-type Na+ transport system ATPase subunit NatA